MRYIGIDYGTKRVGVAFSDEEGRMAFPHDVFENTEELITQLMALIEERNVKTAVFGRSIDLEGNPNVIQKDIERFAEELKERTGVSIVFEPEQYTTREAHHIQGKTSKTDASAAAIILNSFLTREKQ
jgi:putative Holliday junction resolvase